MSKSIDERIVEMRFDNKQFEEGIGTTLNSVDKLKKGLNFEGAAKGLQGINNAARSVSLDSIAVSVDNLNNKFSALGIVGITALQNITNQALNTGQRIISALTIDPMKTGFTEYETKMGAIQTILTNTASKGTTLGDVNAVLGELNTYADQTIYNFSEMTKNIGTFTAAGIGLKESATAIKGIANLAAGSGSTSQQASTAMYQLSQALASGSVKLQDWNSVVNAGMGGELFQKALEKTAVELGNGRNMAVSFRESLQDGWITTDVLTQTLQKFANDPSLLKAATEVKTFTQLFDTMKESVQSGWAVSWENIIGDKNDSTKLLTGISEAFNALVGPSADARNEMLKFWNANGGRAAIIEALVNIVRGLSSVIKPIADAFKEIFPPMTGEKLVKISIAIRDLTRGMGLSAESAESLKNVFKGLFSITRMGNQIFTMLVGNLKPIGSILQFIIGKIVDFGSVMGQWLNYMNNTYELINPFTLTMEDMSYTIEFLGGKLGIASEKLNAFKEVIKNNFVMPGFTTLSNTLDFIVTKISQFTTFVVDAFNGMKDGAGNGLDAMTEKLSVFDVLIAGINKAVTWVKERIGPTFQQIIDVWKGITVEDTIGAGLLGSMVYMIKKMYDEAHKLTSGFKDIANGIVSTLGSVRKTLEAYQKSINAGTLLKIAGAIGILAVSLMIISKVDADRLGASFAVLSGLLIEVMIGLKLLSKFDDISGVAAAAFSMVLLAAAVSILAGAMAKLKDFQSWDETWPGLAAIATLMAGIVISANLLRKVGGMNLIASSIGLIVFGFAVDKLAKSLKTFNDFTPDQLSQGLWGLGKLLFEIMLFIRLSKLANLKSGAATITAVATSMLILFKAVDLFGRMDPTVLAQGLKHVGILLLGLAGAMLIIGLVNVKGSAAAIMAMALALMILTVPIKTLGEMEGAALYQGMDSVILLLRNIVAAFAILSAIQGFGGNLAGVAASMIALALALTLLALPIKLLSNLTGKQLAIGLAGVLAPLFAFVAAAWLLAPLAPILMSLAGILLIFGAATLAIGAGLVLLGMGFAQLALIGAVGAAAIVAVLGGILYGLATVVPDAIAVFARNLANASPMIRASVIIILDDILKVVEAFTPRLVETLVILLIALMDGIVAYGPKILDSAARLIWWLVAGFVKGFMDFSDWAVEGIIALAKSMWIAIKEFLGINSPSKLFEDIGYYVVAGLVNGIIDNVSKAVKVAMELGRSVLDAVEHVLGINSPSTKMYQNGIWSVKGFVGGLVDEGPTAEKAAFKLANDTNKSFIDALNLNSFLLGDLDEYKPTITPVLDSTELDKGLYNTFKKPQGLGINVSSTKAKTTTISNTTNANKSGRNAVDLVATTSNNETRYDIIINNPKPEMGGESVRKTLLKYSYGVYN